MIFNYHDYFQTFDLEIENSKLIQAFKQRA